MRSVYPIIIFAVFSCIAYALISENYLNLSHTEHLVSDALSYYESAVKWATQGETDAKLLSTFCTNCRITFNFISAYFQYGSSSKIK